MRSQRTDEPDVWEPYYRRRNRFFAAWMGIPVALTPVMAVRNAVPAAGALILALIPVVVVTILVQNYRLSHWPCPRCGRHFCWRSGLFNPFAGECMHCGIRIGDNL